MSGNVGWSFGDSNKGGTTWAKSSNPASPVVQTAAGTSVDFFSDNFDVKHLIVVANASQFNALLNRGQQRANTRWRGQLGAHGGGIVSPSGTNSTVVVTMGMLASWGADIAARQKGAAPTGRFRGNPQWNITTELKGALCMVHSGGAPKAGMGAWVTVTVEVGRSGTLYVSHLHAATYDQQRELFLNGRNSVSANDIMDKKRQERFNRNFAEDVDLDLTSLFG